MTNGLRAGSAAYDGKQVKTAMPQLAVWMP
jgi:hypothetical protein